MVAVVHASLQDNMASNAAGNSKIELRKRAIRVRDGLDFAHRQSASEFVRQHGLKLISKLSTNVVAGYHPIGSELDVLPLLASLVERRVATALPVTPSRAAPLTFRRWSNGDPLHPGPYDIKEPSSDAPEVTPAALLVPLVAFDAAGHRLGYGGGHYDRTLAALRRQGTATAIGVAYDEQETDELVPEDHDQTLDWILTQSGARRFKG